MDPEKYAVIDTDEIGINWWDYAGTERESEYKDVCYREAVRRAGDRDLVFASCVNPEDYLALHKIPEQVESTQFIVLCPPDEVIWERLRARPAERGFTSDEKILPHVGFNQWFRKNRGKFPLFLDTSAREALETAEEIRRFIVQNSGGSCAG
jgi:hypothetical protein